MLHVTFLTLLRALEVIIDLRHVNLRRDKVFRHLSMAKGRVKLPPSVSRLLCYIGKKYQRLPLYFQGPGIQWSYSLYCVMQAEVRNPRWRLTNRNTYISTCTLRSDKIPTAISMFSGSRNSMKLFLILCYASGSQKSKMAAHKYRKYSYLSLYTSLLHNYNDYSPFQVHDVNEAILYIVGYNFKLEIQDGGQNISCFQGQGFQWNYSPYFIMQAKSEIQDGGSQTWVFLAYEPPSWIAFSFALYIIDNSFIEFLVLENMGYSRWNCVAVCEPPSWIFDFRLHNTILIIVLLNS